MTMPEGGFNQIGCDCCGGVNCLHCHPAITGASIELTVTGFGGGTDSECDSINDTVSLIYVYGCLWQATKTVTVAGLDYTYLYQFFYIVGIGWRLHIIINTDSGGMGYQSDVLSDPCSPTGLMFDTFENFPSGGLVACDTIGTATT